MSQLSCQAVYAEGQCFLVVIVHVTNDLLCVVPLIRFLTSLCIWIIPLRLRKIWALYGAAESGLSAGVIVTYQQCRVQLVDLFFLSRRARLRAHWRIGSYLRSFPLSLLELSNHIRAAAFSTRLASAGKGMSLWALVAMKVDLNTRLCAGMWLHP